jgi:hypothetical protein
MNRRMPLLATIATTSALALPVAPAIGQPVPDHASCAPFGANVAGLAQALGGDFGATASTVASSGPGVFPQAVVRPEQGALCEPR